MIQRIQTLYMLAAAILSAVCLFLPVASLVPEDVDVASRVYNMFILSGSSVYEYDFGVCGMFIALLISCLLTVVAIFRFRRRVLQARMCLWAAVLLLIWLALYVFCFFTAGEARDASFVIKPAAVLPLISLVLTLLARRAILKDEALVRAADRIR